jgi:AmmeMemoRadiSam system protein A
MSSLSDSDRLSLLHLAREAVIAAVSRGEILSPIPTQGVFAEKRGVFVTLHVRGHLRGCIGIVRANEPLGEAVVRCAASAALQDPRFPAIHSDELSQLQTEISVLSPPFQIRLEDIEIGRHGLLVSRGEKRGLLLPQVAVEHRFTPEHFLRETCRKAELPPDAWSSPEALVQAFTCEVFADPEKR